VLNLLLLLLIDRVLFMVVKLKLNIISRENLSLMRELGDVAAQGRACGNLGNTFYLLGDFAQAIHYHEERLSIARQFGDKAAERRAHSNLGNSHIFMGQFEEAAHHYK
jgi:G-protein signaling modulator 2